MFGFVELITLLLSLSGFGIQPNPKAPTADVSLQYAMPDPDIVVHFDAASVVPNNYKLLAALPNKPEIKSSPELLKMVRQVVNQVEGARGMAKGATGIDLATDVNDATVFLQIVPQKDPNFVATVHGKFSTAVVDKIGKITKGNVTKVGGSMMVEMGPNDPAMGVTKDGVMLVGTPNLVRDRLGEQWKAPPRAPGSNLAYAADVINAKPVYALVLTMSPTARKTAIQGIGGKNFLTDVIQRHKLCTFSVFADGIGWTWIDSTKAGLDQMEMMSQGTLELLKAGQIAPRAMAKIFLGGLDSYKGTDKQVDQVIARKADVLKLIDTYTGDGNFKQTINKDVAKLRLDVRAQGKSLSEVLSAGLLLPGAAAFLLVSKREMKTSASAPVMIEAPPPPAPAPKSPGLGGKKK
ncbi:MAG: hypothetical protein H0T46_11720 [Deltaproteobacteria bacterium]|nr:hypothetical protein [Deltaproteobacteria bacterium]